MLKTWRILRWLRCENKVVSFWYGNSWLKIGLPADFNHAITLWVNGCHNSDMRDNIVYAGTHMPHRRPCRLSSSAREWNGCNTTATYDDGVHSCEISHYCSSPMRTTAALTLHHGSSLYRHRHLRPYSAHCTRFPRGSFRPSLPILRSPPPHTHTHIALCPTGCEVKKLPLRSDWARSCVRCAAAARWDCACAVIDRSASVARLLRQPKYR